MHALLFALGPKRPQLPGQSGINMSTHGQGSQQQVCRSCSALAVSAATAAQHVQSFLLNQAWGGASGQAHVERNSSSAVCTAGPGWKASSSAARRWRGSSNVRMCFMMRTSFGCCRAAVSLACTEVKQDIAQVLHQGAVLGCREMVEAGQLCGHRALRSIIMS